MQTHIYFLFSDTDAFIYISWLIALARTFSILLNRNGESGHPCPVSDPTGKVCNLSPLSKMRNVGLSSMTFKMLRYFPLLYPLSWESFIWKDAQFNSFTQSCPTLCDPMDRSTPGCLVYHQLLEPAQVHVHSVGDAVQPSHPLSSPSPPAFNLFQHHSLFQGVSSSHQMAKYHQKDWTI